MAKKILRDNILSELLKVLIDEWGYGTVRDCLEAHRDSNDAQLRDVDRSKQRRPRKKAEKPTASLLASKISLPPEQKRLIQSLAERYDSKQFLPTAGDIRYFYEIHGEIPPSSKHRSDTFRRILKVLSTLQKSTLRKIIEDNAHSGPTQLGPLSDAMRNAGRQRTIGRDHEPKQVHEMERGVETDQSSQPPNKSFESDD